MRGGAGDDIRQGYGGRGGGLGRLVTLQSHHDELSQLSQYLLLIAAAEEAGEHPLEYQRPEFSLCLQQTDRQRYQPSPPPYLLLVFNL